MLSLIIIYIERFVTLSAYLKELGQSPSVSNRYSSILEKTFLISTTVIKECATKDVQPHNGRRPKILENRFSKSGGNHGNHLNPNLWAKFNCQADP